jgi:hypothetical protein
LLFRLSSDTFIWMKEVMVHKNYTIVQNDYINEYLVPLSFSLGINKN